ncbi:MAG: ABC transporter permease [Calditrichaeota bacterium]|nr:ABC transporter permease [Calditrichota bacterium]
MQPILYMLRKEFKQIFRTREMLAIIFVMPVIQMAVLGFAITNEVKHIKLIISDHDNSRISREIADQFSNTDRFNIVGRETDGQVIESQIHGWNAQMALIIPLDFQRDLQRNQQPDLQIIVDGLDGNTAGVAIGYAQGILTEYAAKYLQNPRQQTALMAALSASSGDGESLQNQLSAAQRNRPHTVSMQQRMWYNLNLDSAQYMVPGIVALLLTIISMMLSSISLVREREIGTLEQLMVTPLKRYQLLLGKLLPFLILAFIEFFVVLQAAQIIFSIHMQGSYVLLGWMTLLYLFTTLGLGVFVSTVTGSQQQAFFVSWFFLVFMIMMSGLFIPIENMPQILQKLTYLNPLRYFIAIVRDVFQKGATAPFLIREALPMALLGLLIFTFSVLNFRKRVQ